MPKKRRCCSNQGQSPERLAHLRKERTTNKCIFFGNMGKEPDLSYSVNGTAIVKATMAVTEYSKRTDGSFEEKTIWLNLVAFGYTAEKIDQRCKSGTQCLVECHYQTRDYEDKNGNKQRWHEFIVDRVEFGKNAVSAGGNRGGDEPVPEFDSVSGERF